MRRQSSLIGIINNSTQVVFKSGKTNFRTFKIQWKTMTQNYGNEEYIEIIRQINE